MLYTEAVGNQGSADRMKGPKKLRWRNPLYQYQWERCFLRQNTHKLFSLPALAFSLPFSFSFTSLHLKNIKTSFHPFYHSILLLPFSIFLTFHLLPRCSLYPFLSLSLFFHLHFPRIFRNSQSILIFSLRGNNYHGKMNEKVTCFLLFFSLLKLTLLVVSVYSFI